MQAISALERARLTPPSDRHQNFAQRLILPYACEEPLQNDVSSELILKLRNASTQAKRLAASWALCAVANHNMRWLLEDTPVDMRHLHQNVGADLLRGIRQVQQDDGHHLRQELAVGGQALPAGACLMERLPVDLQTNEGQGGSAGRFQAILAAREEGRTVLEYIPCFYMDERRMRRLYFWRRVDEAEIAERCRMPFVNALLDPVMPVHFLVVATYGAADEGAPRDDGGDEELRGVMRVEEASEIGSHDDNRSADEVESILGLDDSASEVDDATVVNRMLPIEQWEMDEAEDEEPGDQVLDEEDEDDDAIVVNRRLPVEQWEMDEAEEVEAEDIEAGDQMLPIEQWGMDEAEDAEAGDQMLDEED